MAAGSGSASATTERFVVGAQKSTNQLKALLAKLLPAAGVAGAAGAGAECSGITVDALLSDITDSLSYALASLRLAAFGSQPLPAPAPPGQISDVGGGCGGGRRSAPRRSGQRLRMDGVCRMIVLQNGAHDSYTWRKYGQKGILGARFPRSYFRCGGKPGCPAKKQVQKSDADPSNLEVTYIDAHTCGGPPPSSSHLAPDPTTSSDAQRNAAGAAQLVPVTTVPSAPRYVGRQSSSSSSSRLVPELMIGSSAPRTTDLLPPVAAVPAAAALPRAGHDPAPDDAACTPSMEEEQAVLLHIPSPACSQSELLQPAEASKLSPHSPPLWMEHALACDEEGAAISDFVVPEL